MLVKSLSLTLLFMCSVIIAGASANIMDNPREDYSISENASPQISWQLLHQNDNLAISGNNGFPFRNDSPFKNKHIQLQAEQSISVLLPANHWFYLEFADVDDSNSINSSQANKAHSVSLEALISNGPGLARKITWYQKQQILPPSSQDRVIQISHPFNKKDSTTDTLQQEIPFFMAQGQAIENQSFAPLSWITPENAPEYSPRNPPENTKEQSPQTQRFNKNHQYQDFLNGDRALEFDLEENKIYWQEAVQLTGEVWGQAQHQLWNWKHQAQPQILFATSSVKNLLLSTKNEDPTPLKRLLPQVFKAKQDVRARLQVDGQGFIRLQASDEDWLFAKNYQSYGAPDIDTRLRKARFSQQLQQRFIKRKSAAATRTNMTITNNPTLSVLNNWLTWSDLTPAGTLSPNNEQQIQHKAGTLRSASKYSLQKQNLLIKSLKWDFAGHLQPDLSQGLVSPLHQLQPQSFNHLNKGQELLFYNPLYNDPLDSNLLLNNTLPNGPSVKNSLGNVTNQVQLQLGFVDADTLTAKRPSVEIIVDGQHYATFQYFKPGSLNTLMQNPDWQLKSKASDKTQLISREVLDLPGDWQSIIVNSPDIAVKAKIRTRKPRYPKFDSTQWLSWFSHSLEQSQKTVQLLPDNNKEQSPHWLHFKHFIEVKRQQFESDSAPEIWRKLIVSGEIVADLFNLPMPEGMEGYQTVQTLLQSPNTNQWSYWQTLLTELRNAGWAGYANSLSNTLIRFHPNEEIVEKVALDYMSQLQQAQNGSIQVSLLSYLLQTPTLTDEFKNTVALSLANTLNQQRRFDSALFVLSFVPGSVTRNSLIAQSATQLGFNRLAKAYTASQHSDLTTKNLTAGLLLTKSNKEPTLPVSQQVYANAIERIDSKEVLQLLNAELNVSQENYRASPEQPLQIHVNKGTEIEIEARFWFEHRQQKPRPPGDDWLSVTFEEQQSYLPLYYSEYRSDGLIHHAGQVGAAHRYRVTIPKTGILTLSPKAHSITVRIKEVSTNLQLNQTQVPCHRANTILPNDLSIWQINLPDLQGKYASSEAPTKQLHREFQCQFSEVSPGEFSQLSVSGRDQLAAKLKNRQRYSDFIQRLHKFEMQPDNTQLARLNQTLAGWPNSATRFKLQTRLNANARWLVQTNPIRVKSVAFYNVNTNVPMTGSGYRARLMYIPFKPEWERLSENTSLNYALAVTDQQEYRLKLHSQTHLFQQQSYADVEVTINGHISQVIPVNMSQKIEIPLALPAGTQHLSVRLSNLEGHVSVLTQLQFKEKNQTETIENWQAQQQSVRLRLFHADERQPFMQFFSGSVWLRIDSFNEHGLSKQQFVMAEKGMFSWYPNYPASRGHRIYKLGLLPADTIEAAAQQLSTRQKNIPANFDAASKSQHAMLQFPTFEYLPLQPDEVDHSLIGRSWGLSLSKQQRRSPAEDTAQNNRFLQVQAYSQSSDELRRYFARYQVAARRYDSELSESIHASYQWWDSKFGQNTRLTARLSLAAQNGYQSAGLAWSSQGQIELQWQNSLNRRLFNRTSVRLWGNLIGSGKDTQQFATSVYSQYKQDHRHGLQITENISYNWHHDLVSWASFSLNSNPLSDKDLLDNGIVELGTRIFYQGISADIRWRYQAFMADKDRQTKSHDSRVSAAIEWFAWKKDSHLRVKVNYDRNLTVNENYWGLSISYNDSGARGVQDYMPQSLAFSDLRQQQFVNQRLLPSQGH